MITPSTTEFPRVLLVSDWPPVRGGIAVSSCIVLDRLFCDYPPDRITYAALASAPSWLQLAPSVQTRLNKIPAFPEMCRPCRGLSIAINVLLHRFFVHRLRHQCQTAQTEVLFAVPTVFGHLFRAALSVGRLMDIPVAAFFLDDWRGTYRRNAPWLGDRAGRWERNAIQAARRFYVNGPGMRRHYEKEYGVSGAILWSPVDVDAFSRAAAGATSRQSDEFVIIYTGTIYDAQKDAIDNLVSALDLLKQGNAPPVFLDLYTDIPQNTLRSWGWHRQNVRVRKPVPSTDIPAVLAGADLLFLPLSFSSRLALTVATAAPGKLPEYAASGRPILIHAPAYADVARLCQERGLGRIVDEPDPTQLAAAVEQIRRDNALATRLGERGRAVARECYDRQIVQRNLYTDLAKLGLRENGSSTHR